MCINRHLPTQEQANSNITSHPYINSMQISDVDAFAPGALIIESMEDVPFAQNLEISSFGIIGAAGAKSLIGHHYGGTMSNTHGAPPTSSIIGAHSPGDWCKNLA